MEDFRFAWNETVSFHEQGTPLAQIKQVRFIRELFPRLDHHRSGRRQRRVVPAATGPEHVVPDRTEVDESRAVTRSRHEAGRFGVPSCP